MTKHTPESITIALYETEQGGGGYMYDIYLNDLMTDNADPADGGLYTGNSMLEAFDMATSQARDIIEKAS